MRLEEKTDAARAPADPRLSDSAAPGPRQEAPTDPGPGAGRRGGARGGGGAEGDVSRGTGEFLTDLDGREREEAVRILSDLQAGERRAAAAAGEAAAEAGEGAGGRAPPRGTRSPRRAATARET